MERFNCKARDELFAREIFDTILEARVLHADRCHDDNHHRPHRFLGLQPAAVYAATLTNPKLA